MNDCLKKMNEGRKFVRVNARGLPRDETLTLARFHISYTYFRKTVERQLFHTPNTHDTKLRKTQQHSLQMPYTLELDLGQFPPDVARSFPPE